MGLRSNPEGDDRQGGAKHKVGPCRRDPRFLRASCSASRWRWTWAGSWPSHLRPTLGPGDHHQQRRPTAPGISIEVDDVDAVHAGAAERGLEIAFPCATRSGESCRSTLRDPSGDSEHLIPPLRLGPARLRRRAQPPAHARRAVRSKRRGPRVRLSRVWSPCGSRCLVVARRSSALSRCSLVPLREREGSARPVDGHDNLRPWAIHLGPSTWIDATSESSCSTDEPC